MRYSVRSNVGIEVGTEDGELVSPVNVGLLVVGALEGLDDGCVVGCVDG